MARGWVESTRAGDGTFAVELTGDRDGGVVIRMYAQATDNGLKPQDATTQTFEGTSTDLFVMLGSDFDRPGLHPRANYNLGIGHTFAFLKKDPFGDELTFAYTYENAGGHGFLHTTLGEHTESAGLMKNFALPATKLVTGYTLDPERPDELHGQCPGAKQAIPW
jgi:hypothetical protein